MNRFIESIKGFKVFECSYNKCCDLSKVSILTSEGMAFRFAAFLKKNGFASNVDVMDVFNNLSEFRNFNRFDIHDDYVFDEERGLEFSYVYTYNDTVWAVLYDVKNDTWFGEIEIPCI